MQFLNKIKRAVKAFSDERTEISPVALRAVLDENIPLSETLQKYKILEESLGDGGAQFLGEGTHEEFIDQEREDKGTKKWYERILRRE